MVNKRSTLMLDLVLLNEALRAKRVSIGAEQRRRFFQQGT